MKTVNQKKYCIPGELSEINATIKNLKDARVMLHITSPFNFLIWFVQKTDVSWRMTADTQLAIPIATAVPDVVSLFEQIYTRSAT